MKRLHRDAAQTAITTYTIGYSNPNQADLTNVVISDPLPANTTFVSVTPPEGGTCDAPPVGGTGTVTCTISPLAAGATGTIEIALRLATGVFPDADGTPVDNTATMSSDQTPSVTASAQTLVSAHPTLAISKNVDKTTAAPGDQLTYQLTYVNNGTAGASNVVVSDTLPARTTFVGVTPPEGVTCNAPAAGGTGVVSCTVPSLAPGASGTVTFVVELADVFPNGTTDVTNVAVVNGTLGYANTGNADATGVLITDPLPDKTTFVGASAGCTLSPSAPRGTVTCTVGTIAAQTSGSVTITVVLDTVFPAGQTTITNIATMTSNEVAPLTAEATTLDDAAPNLTIDKTVDEATAKPGDTLHYTLSYFNGGDADATGVVITDVLPAKTTFVSATAPCTFDGSTVTCTMGTVAAQTGGSVMITVQLDTVFPNGPTPVLNTAVIQSDQTGPISSTSTEAQSMTATATSNDVVTGSTITYKLVLDNTTGSANANGVVITDPLPAGVVFVGASPPCTFASGTVTCNVGTVAAGTTAILSVTVETQ